MKMTSQPAKRMQIKNRGEIKKGNFADIKELLQLRGVGRLDGVLLDIGVSSHQLDTASRGFLPIIFSASFCLLLTVNIGISNNPPCGYLTNATLEPFS